MKKFLFLPLLFLLIGCAAQTTGEGVAGTGESEAPASQEGIVQEETTAPTEAAEPASEPTSMEPAAAVPAATTPQEAALIRPQDYVLGAEEPLITIIEYGDFQ